MSNQRNRPDSHLSQNLAAANPGVGNLSREEVAHGKERAPRVPMNTGDFNLGIPDGTIPEGYVGHWFLEDDKGRIQMARAAYWEHVTDKVTGVNIVRPSGSNKLHLMAIEKIYYDEDEALRMERYRASIGAQDNKPLEDGVESYTPSGETNKIRINSDPFA